jgi:FG-GAP-like repeat/Beta-propeller repeat
MRIAALALLPFAAAHASGPAVQFSSFLGGSGFDSINAAAVDSAGNLYLTGETDSPDFPGPAGAVSGRRGRDAFVCKLTNNATTLVYTTILSGVGNDAGRAIAVDAGGNVVVAGVTAGGGFPVSAGAMQTGYGGLEDAFVARLDSTGKVTWATYLGGLGTDVATAVAIDDTGSVYVAGYTSSLRFPTTQGAPGTTHHGGVYDAFVAKLGSSGGLIFSTMLGGSGLDLAQAIALKPDHSACLAGYTNSTDLPVVKTLQNAGAGGDALVACLNPAGNAWTLVTYLGGSGADQAYGLAADASGRLYVTGTTSSSDFPVSTTAFQKTKQAGYDAFVTKLDPGIPSLVYSTLLGGSGSDAATAIAVDAAGEAVITGYTSSLDFPVRNAAQAAASGGFEAFLCRFSGDGSALLNGTYIAGSSDDRGLGVAVTSALTTVVAGYTASPDLGATPGVLQGSEAGSYDGFVFATKYSATAPSVTGDFDGNGTRDLVSQSVSTRQASVVYYGGSDGMSATGRSTLNSGVPGWTVVAVVDWNGDGKPDLIWQNDVTRQVTVNYYGGSDGTTLLGWSWLSSGGAPGWKVVAVADFNGDGKPDLVWQSDTTRQVTVHYFGGAQGNTFLGWNWLNSDNSPGWTVVAAADFNGDGKPDLVWQNDTGRSVTVNYFGGSQGSTFLGWNWLRSANRGGWHVAGAADYNGDGVPDLVWQNDSSGQTEVDFYGGSQGSVLQGLAWLDQTGSPGRRVVVPQ